MPRRNPAPLPSGAPRARSHAWLLRALRPLTSCREPPPLRWLSLRCILDRRRLLHRLSGCFLDGLSQLLADVLSLLLVGRCHMRMASKCPRVSTAACTFVYPSFVWLRRSRPGSRSAGWTPKCESRVSPPSDRTPCPPKGAKVGASRGPSPRTPQPEATAAFAGRRLPKAVGRGACIATVNRCEPPTSIR
jgi:hypothetical protein